MCDVIDNYLNKGEMKGRRDHATETVDRLLNMGVLTNEQIAEGAGVTLDFVLERAGMKTA